MAEELKMTDPRDVQIHIHEHVGPLRERVGKIEGQMQVHDRELTLLRQGIENLRDRIDSVRNALLDALESHTTDEIRRFDEINKTGVELKEKIDSVRNWILAIGLGAGLVFAIVEFMVRAGMLQHGT